MKESKAKVQKQKSSSIPPSTFSDNSNQCLKKEKTVSCSIRDYNSLQHKNKKKVIQDTMKKNEQRALSKKSPCTQASPNLLNKKTKQSIICIDKANANQLQLYSFSSDVSNESNNHLLQTSEKPKAVIASFKLSKEKTQNKITPTTKMSLLKQNKAPFQFNQKSYLNKINISDNLKLNKLLHSQDINNDSDHFDYEKEKQPELSNEEKGLYGQRELPNYQKVKILGK